MPKVYYYLLLFFNAELENKLFGFIYAEVYFLIIGCREPFFVNNCIYFFYIIRVKYIISVYLRFKVVNFRWCYLIRKDRSRIKQCKCIYNTS